MSAFKVSFLRGKAMRAPLMFLFWFALALAPGADAQRPAELTVLGDHVTWPPQEGRVIVQVSAPSGERLWATFEAGEAPSVVLSELFEDGALRDGAYKWSLHFTEDEGAFEGRSMRELAPIEVSVAGALVERPNVRARQVRHERQSGALRVEAGIVRAPVVPTARETEVDASTEPDGSLRTVSSAALADVGDTPYLQLEDTTTAQIGTETDWVLRSDWGAFGDGDEDFSIYSIDQKAIFPIYRYPFVIEDGAPTNSLYIARNRVQNQPQSPAVGIGTNSPSATLDLRHDTPNIRFQDADAGSWFSWEIVADEHRFKVHSLEIVPPFTPINYEPFTVLPRSPSDSLVVTPAGVGLGTRQPQGNLHVFGQADEDVFSGIGPDLVNGPAFNFGYAGASYGHGAGFFNARPAAGAVAPNPALYFMTNDVDRMMIDRDGDIAVHMDNSFGNSFDPQHPIHAQQSGAYLSASGVWRDASSRALKDHIAPLGLDAALLALAALEPVTYVYKAEPEDEVVGFIAEDVPDLVATPDRRTLAPTDIVGVLTKVVQEQQDELATQRRELQLLRQQVESLLSRIE